MRNLILTLGDQLTDSFPALANGDHRQDAVVMAEVFDEGTYTGHHKKKIILLFSAMRHFAEQLRRQGWDVFYHELDVDNRRKWSGKPKEPAPFRIEPYKITREVISLVETHFAHHIQRLMVTGNFALLTRVIPTEICDWYLAVYADAYDWVELPNTLGMVMHADGGYLGSKPYAASGKYIQRMSDYCKNCKYNISKATEDDACPFNALYWHFINHHRSDFENNPRMGMMHRNWEKQKPERRQALLARAEWLLEHIENL